MKECTIEGCDRRVKSRGMCGAHLARHYRGRPLDAPVRISPERDEECIIEGCRGRRHARGMCGAHYMRWLQGRPLDAPLRQYDRDGVCHVGGCGRPREAHELCTMHLRRQQRHGDTGAGERERAPFGEAVWNDPDVRRAKKLRLEYGLTGEAYDEMLRRQGGGCGACGRVDAGSARARAKRCMVPDHDHETGHVRGLLCSPCNRGIGLLGDTLAGVEAAARYLRAARQIPLFGPTHKSNRPQSA